ncbi:MAG TPA: DNA primase [Gemmatimonadaceae bacterium]|jgi:DNA primase
MIRDEIVDRVREEADIVSIVGDFVKLKRVGSSYRGPCPFHNGKGPNFSVTQRGYNCFVCHESGDVFTFVQKQLGLNFVEAVKWVGAKAGVEVPEVARSTEDRDTREPLWEAVGTAADFFRTQLWDTPAGQTARDYLDSRGIDRSTADTFGLGYAPRDAAVMRDALHALGFDDERQLAAGLLLSNAERPEPRPRFRDRLIFPISDASSHVVGFGGRIMGSGEPKYLNSGESAVFSKGKLLYGLNWAKQSIRKADRLIVVEGYFDVIRLMAAGVSEVVAPLGTALTEAQSALIRKYTKNVFLLYDSDQAGLKATFLSGDKLLTEGVSVRVISLPDGEDPDTYVAKFGAAGFERAANASVDVFERKIQILERGGRFADLGSKRKALDKLMDTIRETADGLTRDLYIARTSEVAGVSREQLERELKAPARSGRSAGPNRHYDAPLDEPSEAFEDGPITPPVRRVDRRLDRRALGVRAERELIRMLLHNRRYVEASAERIGADTFADPVYRSIFVELTAQDPEVPIDELAVDLDEEATEVLQELMNENGGLDRAEETVTGSINALLSRTLSERLQEIDRLLPLADSDQKDDLIREKRRLAVEITSLGRPRWKSFNSSRS